MLAALTGCTQNEIAATDIAPETGRPIDQPQNVFVDPQSGKSFGRLFVTPESVSDVEESFRAFLGDTPESGFRAKIIVNPTQEAVAGLVGECTWGWHTACLVIRSMNPDGFGQYRVHPFSSSPQVAVHVFSDLVSQPLPPPDPPPTWGLLDSFLEGVALDITGDADWEMITSLLSGESSNRRNVELGVRLELATPFLATHRAFVPEADGWEYQPRMGLWFDVAIEFPNRPPKTWSCTCNPPTPYGMPQYMCDQGCEESEGHCDAFDVTLKLNRLQFKLGLVPEQVEGEDCNPYRTVSAHADFSEDPRLGWMPNFPGGKPYRQTCFQVVPRIAPGSHTQPVDYGEYFGGDVCAEDDIYDVNSTDCPMHMHVDIRGCSAVAGWVCSTVADCEKEATRRAAHQASETMKSVFGSSMQLFSLPLFDYQSPADGPFADGASHGPACGMLPGANQCPQDLLAGHYVPASLTYLMNDLFSEPFGPNDGKAWHQYPITDVLASCPPGTYETDDSVWGDVCREEIGLQLHPRQLELRYLADPDNDGHVGPDDNCPFDPNPDQLNYDAPPDEFGNVCDNCPEVYNPDQTDSDGDGRGDACDTCDDRNPDLDGDGTPDACETDCPCDPTWMPQDNDGVCNYCDGSLVPEDPSGVPLPDFCAQYCKTTDLVVIDNCSMVNNPDQANCNADAERAIQAEVMGNACDPVPCPDLRGKYKTTKLNGGDAGSNQGAIWSRIETWNGLETIDVEPLGSHDVGQEGAPFDPVEVAVHNVGTEYRYCVDLPAPANIQCERDIYVANHYLRNSPNRAQEDDMSVWHRIDVADLPSPNEVDNPTDFFDYGAGSKRTITWNWQDDFAVWANTWGSGYFTGVPTTPDDATGRFWAHGDTPVGEGQDIGTGLHPVPSYTDDATRMSNYYAAMDPVIEGEWYWIKRSPIELTPPFAAQYCPECPVQIPALDEQCPQCGALTLVEDHTGPYESQFVVGLGAAMGNEVGVLRHDGAVKIVTGRLGVHLRESLASDLVWAAPAEPAPSIGQGWRMPAAVALSTDGTELREQVIQNGRALLGLEDLERPVDVMKSMAAPVGKPSARSEFQTVYSRSTGRVYVVGGTDASSGEPTHDMWWRSLLDGSWHRIPTRESYAPERVMAATYSFADEHLWVLDEHDHGHVAFARLVRVDPESGEHALVGEWPRPRGWFKNRLFNRHWLVVDQDGGVLFVASSNLFRMHAVIRMGVEEGTPRLEGIRVAPQRLVAAPVVDVAGYSFLLQRANNRPPKTERLPDLGMIPGAWADVGGCL